MLAIAEPIVRTFGDAVRLEIDGGVATLRIDRPKMNALDVATQEAIRAAAQDAAQDTEVAAVVVWGGERVFAAGADVKEMADMSHRQMVARSADLQSSLGAVAAIPKPVVAAVNGYALGGGCELALCADVRFAADNARLGQPEILLGIIPGAGGSQRLTRLVGIPRAKDLIFTGRHVGAEEALRIGLVDRVFPAAEVYPAAVAWARGFVGGPALALAAAKASIDFGIESPLATGLEIERQQFASLFATEDRQRGMSSFVENGPGKATFVGA
ncbi:MAG: short chain enoyl-CoA hydratase [Pseudonocardiales bacterium]|jgi:enoyl-CoA hydratase/carnithine racemase|nr:short chain enoyl-CoA hydratase [Pseudonocardiales bacterium]